MATLDYTHPSRRLWLIWPDCITAVVKLKDVSSNKYPLCKIAISIQDVNVHAPQPQGCCRKCKRLLPWYVWCLDARLQQRRQAGAFKICRCALAPCIWHIPITLWVSSDCIQNKVLFGLHSIRSMHAFDTKHACIQYKVLGCIWYKLWTLRTWEGSMMPPTLLHMFRVGQDHIYTVYGVCRAILAGKSPNIRSYTVNILGIFGREITKYTVIYSEYTRYFWQGNHQIYGHIQWI